MLNNSCADVSLMPHLEFKLGLKQSSLPPDRMKASVGKVA